MTSSNGGTPDRPAGVAYTRQAYAGLRPARRNGSTPLIRIVGETTNPLLSLLLNGNHGRTDRQRRQANPIESQVQHRQSDRFVRTVGHDKKLHIHNSHLAPLKRSHKPRARRRNSYRQTGALASVSHGSPMRSTQPPGLGWQFRLAAGADQVSRAADIQSAGPRDSCPGYLSATRAHARPTRSRDGRHRALARPEPRSPLFMASALPADSGPPRRESTRGSMPLRTSFTRSSTTMLRRIQSTSV